MNYKNVFLHKNFVQGFVTKVSSKTIVVVNYKKIKHSKYKKYVNKMKKYVVHDPNNTCKKGETVYIVPSKPYSCTKKWIFFKVV